MLALRLLHLLLPLTLVLAQQSLKLSNTLTIEKTDDKVKTHSDVVRLLNFAKEQKLESNVQRFLDNAVGQLEKVLEAVKVVEQQKLVEVPSEFTPAKYRVKPMPKLQAKKSTVKKTSAKELRQRLRDGKSINFAEPMLVTNGTALFEEGSWDAVRRHWSAGRIMSDEDLERDFRIEYWPPDKARARLVGNQLHMEEPDLVTFSRYLVVCFHGTPAKPKLPGQNTEHCEQNVAARSIAKNASELDELNIFPEIRNALPLITQFRQDLLAKGDAEIQQILGAKFAKKFLRETQDNKFFTFGPSGSGDKLHAENGLPFYDVLIFGSRRWLLLTEAEMERVAVKAREALEFDKTSAYMFFEEKLPELKEEFGLKKFVEINQEAGDLVFVPSGWFRVSLSLADSISYYETLLSEPATIATVTNNNVWEPKMRQYQLAFCYDPSDLGQLPGAQRGTKLGDWLFEAISKVKVEEALGGILANLVTCGSLLALDKSMPELNAKTISMCTPKVWKQCRKQLQAMVKAKGIDVSLSWLPVEAPSSMEGLRGRDTA
jgi:hypothetical protein